jgi:hypothetical protein
MSAWCVYCDVVMMRDDNRESSRRSDMSSMIHERREWTGRSEWNLPQVHRVIDGHEVDSRGVVSP